MAEEALNQEQTDFDGVLPSILSRAEAELENEETEEETASDDAEVETEEAEDTSEEETSEEDDKPKIESVSDLLESNEWDEEWFHNLKVPIKVNGQPAEATFQDLVNSYQTQEAATQRLDEAKSKAQSLNQEATQKLEQSTTELATASALTKLVEETVLKSEMEQLERLKDEHGAGSDEYQAARENLAKRAQGLAQAKQQISAKLNEALKQRDTEPSPEDYAEAQKKLFELHPELEDEGNRSKLVNFALDLGFTQEQLSKETNPLLFSLAWKALKHDETQNKAKAAEKRVKKVPRMLKPGTQQPAKPTTSDPVSILYGKK